MQLQVETLVRIAKATDHEAHEVLKLVGMKRGARATKAKLVDDIVFELGEMRVDDLKLVRRLVRAVAEHRAR